MLHFLCQIHPLMKSACAEEGFTLQMLFSRSGITPLSGDGVDDRRQQITEDVMMSLCLSAVTSQVDMQTNVKIRKSPKNPKPVRQAQSHIAHAVH